MTSKYRPDIDGLRAIAVLSVLLFHLGIRPLRGGGIGVDIFFVISGFLITRIIQHEIEAGRFTYSGFYERRIRRIFPALFAMLAAVIVVALVLFLPSDLKRLGNSTLATVFFSSNVLFWRETGYFSANSVLNPLLHTWSLAFEEQFYIGLPILLMLVHRYAARRLNVILILAGIASFTACVLIQRIRPTATFFLSPFRAWEFVAGALPAIGAIPQLRSNLHRNVLGAVALAVLLASIVLIQASPKFPGGLAAFPVIATVILLHVGSPGSSYVSRLLSIKPLVFVGLISYSLYFWHWPLLVFAKYANALNALGLWNWMLAVLSIVLGWLSYRFVESPFRKSGGIRLIAGRQRFFTAAAATIVATVWLAFIIRVDQGLKFRVSSTVLALDEARTPMIPFQWCDGVLPNARGTKRCLIGKVGSSKRVLVWGGSFALAWVPVLDLRLTCS